MSNFKKVLSFAMALFMVFQMGSVSFAADSNSKMKELKKTSETGVTIKQGVEDTSINLNLWPGEGGAPQVTKIELADYGWLDNGNFAVIIKVYGYGRDNTTFNGNKISYIDSEGFILYGTGVDGFYYLYDCGPIEQAGTYTFKTTFTSTNSPYKQVYFSSLLHLINLTLE